MSFAGEGGPSTWLRIQSPQRSWRPSFFVSSMVGRLILAMFMAYCIYGVGHVATRHILGHQPSPLALEEQVRLEDWLQDVGQGYYLQNRGYRSRFSLCATAVGEERWIAEWLTYHMLIGVDHFYLYDMARSPTHSEIVSIVQPYIDLGVVTLHSSTFANDSPESPNVNATSTFQIKAAEHCFNSYGETADWIAHWDPDEYLALAQLSGVSGLPQRSHSAADLSKWIFPLTAVLDWKQLKQAAGLYLHRLDFLNKGYHKLSSQQFLGELQTTREMFKYADNSSPKCVAHSNYKSDHVRLRGYHGLWFDDRVEADWELRTKLATHPQGILSEVRTAAGKVFQHNHTWPHGLLPMEPFTLNHYLERDYADCVRKIDVRNLFHPIGVSESRWRQVAGTKFCDMVNLNFTLHSTNDTVRLAALQERGIKVEDVTLANSFAHRSARHLLSGAGWPQLYATANSGRPEDLVFN